MPTRQYIGARYVPKIFDNNGSNEWVSGIPYESLTIVTYLGNSYTSIKPVPNNIGSPNLNGEYWAMTGAYNAQVASLSEDVSALSENVNGLNTRVGTNETKIDKLEKANMLANKKFVIVSDSYGGYYNSDDKSFIDVAFEILGITNFYDFHLGSTGFSRESPANFLNVLMNNDSVITDKSTITDIIVCGGANDFWAQNQTQIQTGMVNFMTYVKANYPNAVVHTGVFSKVITAALVGKTSLAVKWYHDASINAGIKYISNSEHIMSRLSYFRNDATHPTSDAINVLGSYLAKYILDGYFDVIDEVGSTLESLDENVSINDYFIQRFKNGVVTLCCNSATMFRLVNSEGFTYNTGTNTITGKIKFADGFVIPKVNGCCTIYGLVNEKMPAILYVAEIVNYGVVNIGMFVYNNTGEAISDSVLKFNTSDTTLQPF